MHLARRVRPPMSSLRRPVLVAAVLSSVIALAACGSSSDSGSAADAPTVTPATASPAPAGPAHPGGVIIPTPPGSSVLARSGPRLAVVAADGNSILRFDTAAMHTPPTTLTTHSVTVLIGTGAGAFLGAGPRRLTAISADGTVTTAPLGTDDPTALARLADGRVLVGTGDGHVLVLDAALRQQRDIAAFVRVGAITVSPPGADLDREQVVVLDPAQSSVTPVDPDTGELGAALRAGNGATNATVDHFGRILVANTRDGQLVGFFGAPLVMRLRYPVADGPFAVDYDDTRNLLWVSTTANNEVVAYDLASGEPAERLRVDTVAQPDALAVDDTTGTVYVLSHRDGGIHVVSP
ncbi:MAG: hypothetical protein QM662_06205 [Gordonia sp. (in: high G+C Gram-positive bacteria)]